MNQKVKIAEVLIIDESVKDSFIISSVFERSVTPNRLSTINDYNEGLTYIKELEAHYDKKPDLIIMDIASGGKERFDILKEIKTTPDLAHIPVIVLSRLDKADIINKCYELHASSFIKKPVKTEEFINTVENIENFWFSTAKLSFLV